MLQLTGSLPMPNSKCYLKNYLNQFSTVAKWIVALINYTILTSLIYEQSGRMNSEFGIQDKRHGGNYCININKW